LRWTRREALLHRIDGYWYTPAPAERLAALRLIIGGFALAYLLLARPI
jgi:hypothetical protein